MSYKTILVQVDDSSHVNKRIQAAADIAMRENAHLIGVAMTGVSKSFRERLAVALAGFDLAPYLGTVRQRAEDALTKFENIARQRGVTSLEKRLLDDEAAEEISLQARCGDLLVLGQRDPDDLPSTPSSNLAEYAVLNGGVPALIIPHSGDVKSIGERTLIGWNASVEATRAVRNAIPLLKRSKIVKVALFQPKPASGKNAIPLADDIAAYLARHGIKVDVMRQACDETTEGEMGTLLLSLAADLDSDLLVMGCYGHLRFREILLGGATRTVMESMTIPVLMAH